MISRQRRKLYMAGCLGDAIISTRRTPCALTVVARDVKIALVELAEAPELHIGLVTSVYLQKQNGVCEGGNEKLSYGKLSRVGASFHLLRTLHISSHAGAARYRCR